MRNGCAGFAPATVRPSSPFTAKVIKSGRTRHRPAAQGITEMHSNSTIADAAASGTEELHTDELPPEAFADLERWAHFPEYPEYAKGIKRTPWPPGFLGQVAKYLFCHAPAPVPEYAIATAIGFFAGICGRGWIYSGTGLNHDIIVLGESGTGKNIVHQGTANIANQLSGTPVATFIVNAKMASAQALLKNLAANPCFLQLTGEVGKMYRAYAKSRHGDNIDQLFTAKLDLWERSGPDGSAVGILYSDSEKNVDTFGVTGIAHSTLGESTPAVFYGALDTDMMNEGLLSRLWIIEYEGPDPAFNERRLHKLPAPWVTHLSNIVRASAGRLSQQPIGHDADALALIRQFSEECRDEKLNAGRDPAQRQLWVRAYEKVIRLAGLLAVADNYVFPRLTVAHVEWAIAMLRHANLTVQRRVSDGDIGDDADHTREQMIVHRCKRWLIDQRKDPKEEAMRVNMLIPRRFLQQEVASKEAFRNHRLGATTVFNLTMKSLVDSGVLMEVERKTLLDKFGIRAQCWRLLEA